MVCTHLIIFGQLQKEAADVIVDLVVLVYGAEYLKAEKKKEACKEQVGYDQKSNELQRRKTEEG